MAQPRANSTSASTTSPSAAITLPANDGAIARPGRQGLWYEREFAFDAAFLTAGAGTLAIIVPASPINNGIPYDFERPELDEPAAGPARD